MKDLINEETMKRILDGFNWDVIAREAVDNCCGDISLADIAKHSVEDVLDSVFNGTDSSVDAFSEIEIKDNVNSLVSTLFIQEALICSNEYPITEVLETGLYDPAFDNDNGSPLSDDIEDRKESAKSIINFLQGFLDRVERIENA